MKQFMNDGVENFAWTRLHARPTVSFPARRVDCDYRLLRNSQHGHCFATTIWGQRELNERSWELTIKDHFVRPIECLIGKPTFLAVIGDAHSLENWVRDGHVVT